MIKELNKSFVNHKKNKKDSIEVKKELINLTADVNRFLSTLYKKESGKEYTPPEKIPSEFPNDDEKNTYKRDEYNFGKFTVLVEERAHFDLHGGVDFYNFKNGSLNVTVSADSGTIPKEILDGLEFLVDPRKAAHSYNRRI